MSTVNSLHDFSSSRVPCCGGDTVFCPGYFSSVKAKCVGSSLHRHDGEPCGLQARTQSFWIDWDESVADMDEAHPPALQTVAPHKDASWLQYPPSLAKNFVLKFWGWHVVKHGESNNSRKRLVRKRHGRGIARDDVSIAPKQACAERRSQARIQFQRDDLLTLLPQKIGGQSRTGAEFQHAMSQRNIRNNPWNPLLNGPSPLCRTTKPPMEAIHAYLTPVALPMSLKIAAAAYLRYCDN